MKRKYNDYSLEQCAEVIERKFATGQWPEGTAFFQKWTCEKCGERVTGNEPNKLFMLGHHEDCGHITDLRKTGCNYMVHMVFGGVADMPPQGSA